MGYCWTSKNKQKVPAFYKLPWLYSFFCFSGTRVFHYLSAFNYVCVCDQFILTMLNNFIYALSPWNKMEKCNYKVGKINIVLTAQACNPQYGHTLGMYRFRRTGFCLGLFCKYVTDSHVKKFLKLVTHCNGDRRTEVWLNIYSGDALLLWKNQYQPHWQLLHYPFAIHPDTPALSCIMKTFLALPKRDLG